MRPGPRDAFDPPDPDLAAHCAMCRNTYNLDTSDALNPNSYCSRECEREDTGLPTIEEFRNEYLRPAVAHLIAQSDDPTPDEPRTDDPTEAERAESQAEIQKWRR